MARRCAWERGLRELTLPPPRSDARNAKELAMTRPLPVTALAAALVAAGAFAQQPSPTPAPTPPARPEMIDLRFIRMKISAGDLPSAESILEVHRAEKGEDGEYLLGLSWLARGAALMEDWPAASRYAKAARELAVARLGTPPDWENAAGGAIRARHRHRGRGAGTRGRGKKSQALSFSTRTRGPRRRRLTTCRPGSRSAATRSSSSGRRRRRSAPRTVSGRSSRASRRCAGSRSCSSSGGRPAGTARRRRPP